TRLLPVIFAPLTALGQALMTLDRRPAQRAQRARTGRAETGRWLWFALVAGAVGWAVWLIAGYVAHNLSAGDVLRAFGLGVITMVRVLVL
ncbi:hypothetical protein ACPWML_25725, partial [Pandoraea pneumonica]